MPRPGFDGLLVIDKPSGMTSRDVVNRALGWFPRKTRVGHAGTLDPLATGVLVLCVGVATRLIEYVQRMPKVYRAGVILGATSDTDDADGLITPMPDARMPTRAEIDAALAAFLGPIEQTPPAYSAAKVQGRRAYALARQGADVTLAPRVVTIHAIDVLDYTAPRLDIEVHCGKGTYIRSLARDLGARLGCGGYIASLRRLRIGCFDEANSLPLDTDVAGARARLLPIAQAVHDLPRITLTNAAGFLHGQSVPLPGEPPTAATEVAVFDDAGRLIAIAAVDGEKRLLRPDKVFVSAD